MKDAVIDAAALEPEAEAPQKFRPSFAFAKRQGVLVDGERDGQPLVRYRGDITPQTLAEVRRFPG